MFRKLLKLYVEFSLIKRIMVAFIMGAIIGVALYIIPDESSQDYLRTILTTYVEPWGQVLINMLKMLILPLILTSILTGVINIPLERFGHIGLKIVVWYIITSFVVSFIGVQVAVLINPGDLDLERWKAMAQTMDPTEHQMIVPSVNPIRNIFLSLFQNPFSALSSMKSSSFLGVISFSILFGMGLRFAYERKNVEEKTKQAIDVVINFMHGARVGIFEILNWVLEYTPIGVFALSLVNFNLYGPEIIGSYAKVIVGVITAVFIVMFIFYPILLSFKKIPFIPFFKAIREAIITSFITRSSAATLPVSIHIMTKKCKVKEEIVNFALPLGSVINMHGVCVHLPVFAILATNMFGIPIHSSEMFVLTLTTVFAAIGTGSIPGGSVMLLFLILESIGLSSSQIALVISFALAINPILDMFETANNVTGDMVCTYIVAKSENMIEKN